MTEVYFTKFQAETITQSIVLVAWGPADLDSACFTLLTIRGHFQDINIGASMMKA